ncbi:hypothetical protein TWF569_010703 [Orbilia oligospora]|uniref:ferric-chelate reductase (NADPH) n=1 Tax=Orbilia oligospora TaxID=2813651 RepID=A0A7C8J6R1_ORBOL|nr:hypothetical protein TWF103_000724 [Orbilia oligospora]KAF3090590.1 hypothetical protein TWF102_009254 [Orbilia oligospora]KAF3090591.1 hypothetical protein TWF102_009254 [Orbilia oligospora]KAF3108912.1 hypothetical protein TWF706_001747 [Orbilia oligospora]KAF3133265.1 hypothetical protein TWF569_010703 [Orbilia oligospora]
MILPRASHTTWDAQDPNDTPDDINFYTWGLNGVNQWWNDEFSKGLFTTSCILVLFFFAVRISMDAMRHLRLLVLMSTDNSQRSQRYWSRPSPFSWKMKKYLWFAPIWKHRHNTEIQLSKAITIGTLPTRLHAVILGIYVISNVIYCTLLLDYSKPKRELVAEFRGRTGVLAVVNMVPLFLLAGRNNILIPLLKISFDTYNIIHRCLGRLAALQSVAHTAAWLINKVDAQGFEGVKKSLVESEFILYGMIAVAAFALIFVITPSPVRHAFYETFLVLHIGLAILILYTVWMHLKIDNLPQLPYIILAIAFWSLDRFIRLVRVFYRNISTKSMTKVKVEALDGDACRVTFELARPWTFKPGQHVYIYFPTVSYWQSHPFSLAWSSNVSKQGGVIQNKLHEEGYASGDLPIDEKNATIGPTTTQMSLLVARREGMTKALYEKANAAPNRTITLRGFVEGPYGGMHQLESYGTTLLFAGGIGITHQLGYVRQLIEKYQAGACATRKITLIWVVKTTDQVKWIEPYMREILSMDKRREVLKVLVYITRPKADITQVSPTGSVELRPGRPNFDQIMDTEVAESIGTVAATVCGPGPFQDSVRAAVRNQLHRVEMDFYEESFTW